MGGLSTSGMFSPARRVEKISVKAPLRWISEDVLDFVQKPVYSVVCGAVIAILGYGAAELAWLPLAVSL